MNIKIYNFNNYKIENYNNLKIEKLSQSLNKDYKKEKFNISANL